MRRLLIFEEPIVDVGIENEKVLCLPSEVVDSSWNMILSQNRAQSYKTFRRLFRRLAQSD
jgi:hypothetical protein